MQTTHKPYILIVLDGWGYSDDNHCNAINSANKPVWNKLWNNYPHTLLSASGLDVGLPDAQMGNSEVGHMNIGSGRVVDQEFTRISRAISDGSFFDNKVLCPPLQEIASNGKAMHIIGLLSPGGVHSHQDHICALLKLGEQNNVKNIYVHAFLDGRDTPPRSAKEYLKTVQQEMTKLGVGRYASVVGRYYAMDRNQNWERTQLAYDLLCDGKSEFQAADVQEAIDMAYSRNENDEFIAATSISDSNGQAVQINDGDVVVFANYRADRARQLSQAFTETGFNQFRRARVPALHAFISLTEYKADFSFPAAYPPEKLANSFGEFIAAKGLRQLRIAETEKYAHVTFFFNGGEECIFDNEDRILVPSPDVATYDLKPEMSAFEVTDKLIEAIQSNKYDAIICNFANADMVGHTGDFDAAIKAIETLDACIGKIVDTTQQVGGEILITADHGNAEQMRAKNSANKPVQNHTAHTNNLVPLLYIGRPAVATAETGALCDISPTLLNLMGLTPPPEMTGKVLFQITDYADQVAIGK